MNKGREGLFLLMRGNIHRNEVDPMQLATLHRSPRQCNMAAMHRVESPSE